MYPEGPGTLRATAWTSRTSCGRGRATSRPRESRRSSTSPSDSSVLFQMFQIRHSLYCTIVLQTIAFITFILLTSGALIAKLFYSFETNGRKYSTLNVLNFGTITIEFSAECGAVLCSKHSFFKLISKLADYHTVNTLSFKLGNITANNSKEHQKLPQGGSAVPGPHLSCSHC